MVWKILNGKYKDVEKQLNEAHKKSNSGISIKQIDDYCGSGTITIVLRYRLKKEL